MGAHDLLGYPMENSMFLFKYIWSHENYVGSCVCASLMFNAIERFPMIRKGVAVVILGVAYG
jgi:hypothetical protein